MKTLNYRHSIETMNAYLASHNERVTHTMQAGKDLFTVSEKVEGLDYEWRTCGFFYKAGDVAKYINSKNKVA